MNKCLAFQFWEIAFKGDKAVLDNVLLTVKDSGKHLGTDYGHTMAKFLTFCNPNSNSNPKYLFGIQTKIEW